MPKNEELICISANGKRIVFDPINSHAAFHFNDTPKLRMLTKELLEGTDLVGKLIAKDVDMGRIIGTSNVVDTDKSDDIVYALRKNREEQGYVPFTKSKSPKLSSLISVYLIKKETINYELLSVWVGSYKSPPFPQMENFTDESIPYWSNHAFAWGSQEIIPDNILLECPW